MKNLFKTRLVLFSLIIVIAGFACGFFLPDKPGRELTNYFSDYLKNNVKLTFISIFMNNLSVSAIILFGGFLFSVISLFFFFIQFLLLGTMFRLFLNEHNLKIFMLSTFPHGIFEIPAIFISFVLGIAVTSALVLAIRKRDIKGFLSSMNVIGTTYILTVVPLLAIAAFVEVNFTPWFINNFK